LTRAIPEVARKAGITQKKAREILKEYGPAEWHHTGKYYKKTWYYSIDGAVEFWRKKTKDALRNLVEAIENGISTETLLECSISERSYLGEAKRALEE